ncbi:MAG: transcriptional regulator FtrA [Sphingosinicella sp.]|nr:transcriptional regulator FtrA [Sphingosinicella sp.]
MKDHLVALLAYDGLCAFEFGCAVEIFGLARPELEIPWYDFKVCGIEPGPLRSIAGMTMMAPHGLEQLASARTIIIPGWRGVDAPVPEELIAILRDSHERGARIASVCSGAFVLAATGLLDGRRATTHWRYAAALARNYPAIEVDPDILYADEGSLITSAGSAAGIDMMLHLIRRDHGAKICNLVARRLVTQPHREGGQAQFIDRPVPAVRDSRLAGVLDYIRRSPAEDHEIGDLAARAAMSPRSFFRKFRSAVGMSPYEWLTRERVEIAKELLEESDQSIDQIAEESGFGATETLRYHFRRIVGKSPSDYRSLFSSRAPGATRPA